MNPIQQAHKSRAPLQSITLQLLVSLCFISIYTVQRGARHVRHLREALLAFDYSGRVDLGCKRYGTGWVRCFKAAWAQRQ